MPESLFNQNVTGWAVAPGSSEVVATVNTQWHGAYGSVSLNADRPVYWVPPDQTLVPISIQPGCKDFTVNSGRWVPIPSDAVTGDDSDRILTIYQPSTQTAWEFWEATDTNGSWSACWGGKLDMSTSDGVFPFPYGETATGISNLATEITEADVRSGSIKHAIAIQVLGDGCDWDGSGVNGGLPPADRADCGYSTPGWPEEGMWFRFAPGTAMPSGLAPLAQMVFKAGLKYGFIVVDQGAAVGIEADQLTAWSGEGHSGPDPISASQDGVQSYQVIAGLPWDDLQLIVPPGQSG
jgi:hypothetical protein